MNPVMMLYEEMLEFFSEEMIDSHSSNLRALRVFPGLFLRLWWRERGRDLIHFMVPGLWAQLSLNQPGATVSLLPTCPFCALKM